jgi:hypothetical protein
MKFDVWRRCIVKGRMIYLWSVYPWLDTGCRVEYEAYKKAIVLTQEKGE